MTASSTVFLWGATGHALVVRELLEFHACQIGWIFDNNPSVRNALPDVPLIGDWGAFLEWNPAGRPDFIVAIGGDRGRERYELQKKIAERGFVPFTALHPRTIISTSARIGQGSQVLAGAILGVRVTLGDACIINTGAQIDHESTLGNGVHVMPGAILAGCVAVGDYATIGSGAVILPRLTIGAGAYVGAGAVVTKNVLRDTIVTGIPAKIHNAKNHDTH